MALGLDVKHPRYLALCIRRTPDLSVKTCVNKRNVSGIKSLSCNLRFSVVRYFKFFAFLFFWVFKIF